MWWLIMICTIFQSRFLDIFVGYPGSVHDSWILKNSYVFIKFSNINLHLSPAGTLLLSDCRYPLLDWLVTPYHENGHLTQQQKHYNKKHSSPRIKIEQAFRLLKSRWRCLRNNLEVSIDIVPHVIFNLLCIM